MRNTGSPVPETEAPDPILQAAIEALISGTHGAPFDILGPHRIEPTASADARARQSHAGAEPTAEPTNARRRGEDATPALGVVSRVRVWLPAARAAWLVPLASQAEASGERQDPLPMQQLHSAGLFTLASPVNFTRVPYAVEAEYADGTRRRARDPYAFGPLLTDFDLHLLGEGTDLEAYRHLGAHPRTIAGAAGIAFAVWAPNAKRVSVAGDFNAWDERALPMRARTGGIWELFVPDLSTGALYKYAILSRQRDYHALKADPYAFAAELRPGTASRVWDLGGYAWRDDAWLAARAARDPLAAPMTIYELHAGSWCPDRPADARPSGHEPVSYRGLAHQLVPYLLEMGYTHVELMPIAEYPFDGSWGYQVTGYYAPTSRYGTPQDFMYFVDYCHQHGIGVLLDWVPAHFPKDGHGLNYFDGSHLYEHADPRQGEHPDWGTLVFNLGRHEVANFLLANALFWLDTYHVDGLRVDAVASMLYLDYSRKSGEWLPNEHGGRENLDAVAFLHRFNELLHERFPGAVTIAEESTAWPAVSRPIYVGGLGFTFKWNMGWMHDILRYFAHDPIHRRFHHNELTFSLMYTFSENFILPFSHDEVVHIKGSMLNKMPGDVWQKLANLRALYAYMYGHPGKKLLFMGGEFGQWSEWNFAGWLDWHLLNPAENGPSLHAQLQHLVRDLNHLLRASPALFERDFDPMGFTWIDGSDAEHSVIAFTRNSAGGGDVLLFVCNFTPVARYHYRVGVPRAGFWAEVLNTDSDLYGGGNVGNQGGVQAELFAAHGHEQSVSLTLPPLATIILRPGMRLPADTVVENGVAASAAPGPTAVAARATPARRQRATEGAKPTGAKPTGAKRRQGA
jgi:1,4-alpha-glucan branching enzyme